MPNLENVKHAVVDAPVEEILLKRWSPRAFAPTGVSKGDLKTLFTAAAWAASSYNEQPWRFVVGIRGDEKADETYKKILNSLMPMNQAWAASAPVLVAAFGKKTFSANGQTNKFNLHDTGAAMQNLALQATQLGLHVHGMGGYEAETLRAYFAVPSDFEPAACWAIGYPGDPESLPENYKAMEKQPRQRKPLSSFVFTEWDKPADL